MERCVESGEIYCMRCRCLRKCTTNRTSSASLTYY